jgi:predicted DNA-binding transcriptional regulator YafY
MTELAWHLFTWGDKLDILGPASLKTAMRDALALAMARLEPAA